MQRLNPKLENVTKLCDLIEMKIHMIENCTEKYKECTANIQDALLNKFFNDVRIKEK